MVYIYIYIYGALKKKKTFIQFKNVLTFVGVTDKTCYIFVSAFVELYSKDIELIYVINYMLKGFVLCSQHIIAPKS